MQWYGHDAGSFPDKLSVSFYVTLITTKCVFDRNNVFASLPVALEVASLIVRYMHS